MNLVTPSPVRMHLTQHICSNIQKHVRREYKDALWLVQNRLDEYKEKNAQPGFPHFDEGGLINTDVGAGHVADKRGLVHYRSCSH